MKYFILLIIVLCSCLLILGAFGAFCAVILATLVQMYLCRTERGKIVKIGLARMLIKLEKLFE